jgi:hypothetical protein
MTDEVKPAIADAIDAAKKVADAKAATPTEPSKTEPPKAVVAPSAPAAAPVAPPVAPPDPELTRQQKLTALCEQQFLRIQELQQPAMFSHRGYCTKCGWQSMQHSAEDAHTMVARHVLTHWRDVASQL